MPTAAIRGLSIEHERQGSGPSLLWGHGLTSSRAHEAEPPVLLDWDRIAAGADVVRYDAAGHGRSDAATDLDRYRWDELARDQQLLADHLGIGPSIVGGASMGAATALHRAVLFPDQVRALVLVIPPTAWATRAAQSGNYQTMADLIEAGSLDRVLAGGRQVPPPDPFAGLDTWHERGAARLRAIEQHRLAGLFRGAAAADLPSPEAVSTIGVPCLILAWTGDPGHPVDTARRLGELLPDATVGEASTAAAVEAWTDRVIDFVASV